MTDLKTKLDEQIKNSVELGESEEESVRRIYCFNGSPILSGYKNEGFSIINQVALYFSIPFKSIYIAGSVQTGYSYFKNRDFTPKESDLDLAIVDTALFTRYCEIVYKVTSGYTDQTKFPMKNGVSQAEGFQTYLVKGYFRPDLMPNCIAKQEWFKFFNVLSRKYSELFLNVNCGIYLSEQFFEGKQVPTINKIKREAL